MGGRGCRAGRAAGGVWLVHGGSGSPEVWALERASFLVDVILEDDVTPPGRRVRAAERRTLSRIGPLINHWSDAHTPAVEAARVLWCGLWTVEAALEAAWLVMGCGRGDW